jgi:molybdate transport system permease protein
VPLVAVLLALVAVTFFLLPLLGLLQRAPWSEIWGDLTDPAARDAIRLSVECSLWSTALSITFGVPLAYVLARSRFPGRALVRALVVLPMVLPPVVGGIALLFAFQRNNGLIGGWLYDAFGLQFTFSKTGVILAETFVAMPFLVITVEAGLRSMDRRYEDAAASLGANRWTVFRRVTLPLIGPALFAGAALAWARALGEFGATITFAGNIQGRTQTIPLAVYNLLETDQGTAIALSLLLLAVSIIVLVLLHDHWFGGLRDP